MTAASAPTAGWGDWSLDPALALIIAAALLYVAGGRPPARTPRREERFSRRLRSVSFYTALAALAIALNSPLEALSRTLFWAHMVQHVLLLLVAPPLIVIARPWMRLWRALPLGWRRSLARGLGVSGRTAWLRWIARTLGRPLPSFLLFCGTLAAWHVPALFDATLSSVALHATEHAMFFTTALMFWKQVLHSPPLRVRLSEVQRIGYVVGAMVASWALAVVLAFAPAPLYALYAQEVARPGGISALGDQQIAAGIMWVPGSLSFAIVIFVYMHRWLSPVPAPASAHASLARGHSS